MSKTHGKSRVRGIAVFVVLLALAISGYQTYKFSGQKTTIDTRTPDDIFRTTSWMYKSKLILSANEAGAIQKLSTIMNEFTRDVPVHSRETAKAGTYIFKVENSRLPELKSQISKIASITTSESFTDSSLVSTNVDLEEQRLESYRNEWATLDAIRLRSEVENRRMDHLNQMIRETLDKLERLQSADQSLLYVIVSPAGSNASLTGVIIYFVKKFAIYLLILAVAVMIVYFGVRLLMYLLAMLGIKGFGLDNALQNYSYRGYGGYGSYTGRYSYGNRSRKVKRIYKDKRANSEDEQEEPRD